jgi:membrane-associated protein
MFDVKEIMLGMVPYTQYISFGLIMLAGVNIPVSEDIVIIVSASIAATKAPHNVYYIFAGCFLGAYLSDIAAYVIGRYGINKILFSTMMIRSKIVNREKVERKIETIRGYFTRYGGKTLFFARFFPFGVRNVTFMTCGLIKMKMAKFMIIDICAATCTTTILFCLGYTFGNNYEMIFPYLNRYKFIILGIFFAVIFLIIIRKIILKRTVAP